MAAGMHIVAALVAELSGPTPEGRRVATDELASHIRHYSPVEASAVGRALVDAWRREDDARVRESITDALEEMAANRQLGPELMRSATEISDAR